MERAIPILPVEDLRVARAFYVDKLGFSVRFEAKEHDKQGLIGVDRGGISLTLDCPMTGHGREACVGLQVESADAYYEEWRSRGVEMKRPPMNEPWGARTFSVIDPFGNTLFVMTGRRFTTCTLEGQRGRGQRDKEAEACPPKRSRGSCRARWATLRNADDEDPRVNDKQREDPKRQQAELA